MIRPDSMQAYGERDLKLGIKSSLPNVKGTVALAILLWECAGHPAELVYSKQVGNETVLTDELEEQVRTSLSDICAEQNISDNALITKINENQLFKSQLEALIVAFELIWKIARISFEDTSKAAGAERTGGVRYSKRITYSSNIDVIHCTIEGNRKEYLKTLLSWLGLNIICDQKTEKILVQLLTALSEEAVFKLVDGNNDVIFNENSIYKKLLETEESVDINGDKEPKGSLRILKSLLSDGMNPYLQYSGGKVTSSTDYRGSLASYQERVDTFLQLSSTKVIGLDNDESDTDNTSEEGGDKDMNLDKPFTEPIYHTGLDTGFSLNRIIFGAPGTGKSYGLEQDRKKILHEDENNSKDHIGDYERVTFHPDYTYSQFVGTYKPVSEGKEIYYKFVPGPFMRIFVKAIENGKTDNPQPYVLLVEEINRAPVAAVFGDIFQLLDRDDDGSSQYEIEASEDIRRYLADKLGGEPDDYERIKIPDNMYIWATMNSADQGVFPMDTAFKRRWDFTYLGVDDNDKDIRDKYVTVGSLEQQRFKWNELRKAINAFLAELKVNEDKQLGPYFISRSIVVPDGDEIDPDKFAEVFKNKVLMYLFEDAARQRRSDIFKGSARGWNRYSQICQAFDEQGIGIFHENIQNAVKVEDLAVNGHATRTSGASEE